LFVVPTEAHGQQVFARELPFGVEELRVDGEAPGAIAHGWRGSRSGGLGIAGAGDGAKTLPHHSERLPEQGQEAEAIEERKKIREG
jgi:hypothetical protein